MPLAPPLHVRLLCAIALLFTLGGPAAAQDGTWALTNARIETVTRGVIERGTIVIRDGLIEAVGSSVAVPPDARVMDIAGQTVYPGLIDLTSTLGLPAATRGEGTQASGAAAPPGGARGTSAGAVQARHVGLEPARLVADEIRPSITEVRAARDAGLTAVLVAPDRGAFRGLSALVPLRDSLPQRAVIRSPVALHMGFEGVRGRYPGTLLGVIAYERQALYDAQHHAAMLERHRANPRGVARPVHDSDLDALVPVVRGALPAFFAASTENEIRRAVRIGRELDLALTIVGATEGFRALDALRGGRPVVVVVNFPKGPEATGWSYRVSQRRPPGDSAAADSAARRLLEGNPAAMHRAGIRFALASGGTRTSDFFTNVRAAIAAGLPRDVALQALTIRPAEIAGAGEMLGSVEVGKIANLVVAQGDLLGDSARVRAVFVDGIRHEVIEAPRTRAGRPAGDERGRGEADVARVAGTWAVTVTTPDGQEQGTLTLVQDGESLSGTMTSRYGSAPISGGRVTGSSVTWRVNITVEGQQLTAIFRGDAEGNRITGNADVGEFPATFTAERIP